MTEVPPKKKHGGSRAGSGRPRGRLNTLTEAEKRKALARGLSALEIMTDLMNHNYRRWKKESDKPEPDEEALMSKHKATLESATALAPYVHPKLAAVQHTGKNGGAIQFLDLSKLSDEQLATLEPVIAALAAAGAAVGADPEGEGSSSA
ncbi:hypothetical protein [Labrys neptuniae]